MCVNDGRMSKTEWVQNSEVVSWGSSEWMFSEMTVLHKGDKCNAWVMQNSGEGLILLGGCRFVLLGFGCMSFGCSGGGLGKILGYMSGGATEKAEAIVKTVLTFLSCQFTILSELRGEIGRGFLLFRSTFFV